MTTVAELVAVIGADVTGLRRGLQETEAGLEGLGQKIRGLGSGMSELGMRIIGASGPLRSGFSDGLDTAMEYEDILAEFGARTMTFGDGLQAVSSAGKRNSLTLRRLVEALAKFLARLEKRNKLLFYRDRCPCPRIAALSRRPVLYRKRAETA